MLQKRRTLFFNNPVKFVAVLTVLDLLTIVGVVALTRHLVLKNVVQASFEPQKPEADKNSTWACYLEAGSKELLCADYATVTTEMLRRSGIEL